MITFTIASGQTIEVTHFQIQPTDFYVECDEERFIEALTILCKERAKSAIGSPGVKHFHLILPAAAKSPEAVKEAVALMRIFKWRRQTKLSYRDLGASCLIVRLTSRFLVSDDQDAIGSELVVAWFDTVNQNSSLHDIISDAVNGIPWPSLAGDLWPNF